MHLPLKDIDSDLSSIKWGEDIQFWVRLRLHWGVIVVSRAEAFPVSLLYYLCVFHLFYIGHIGLAYPGCGYRQAFPNGPNSAITVCLWVPG